MTGQGQATGLKRLRMILELGRFRCCDNQMRSKVCECPFGNVEIFLAFKKQIQAKSVRAEGGQSIGTRPMMTCSDSGIEPADATLRSPNNRSPYILTRIRPQVQYLIERADKTLADRFRTTSSLH